MLLKYIILSFKKTFFVKYDNERGGKRCYSSPPKIDLLSQYQNDSHEYYPGNQGVLLKTFHLYFHKLRICIFIKLLIYITHKITIIITHNLLIYIKNRKKNINYHTYKYFKFEVCKHFFTNFHIKQNENIVIFLIVNLLSRTFFNYTVGTKENNP